jgi:purine-binding chemotaxis protein CheW
MGKDIQLVGFRIGRETFGIPIGLVREIVRMMEITAVPDAPNYVEGVINLLIVDAASEVLKLARGEIEPPPELLQENDLSYVTGLGKRNGKLIILVDVEKILSRGELGRLSELTDLQPTGAA